MCVLEIAAVTFLQVVELGVGPDQLLVVLLGLGLGLRKEVMEAEEHGTAAYGAGRGAVRFISGTYAEHTDLEEALARFHGREAGMVFSSAYATTMGVLTPLLTGETVVISDELNHNCIINAARLARPAAKAIYAHNDVAGLEGALERWVGKAKRAFVVTDGIFSMRGDHAPLAEIEAVCRRFDEHFEENVVLLVDDSIVRFMADREQVLRRARGYAPLPVSLPSAGQSNTCR